MATHELTKTIEARKVNRRSGLPTNDPPISIPYGALLDELEEDRGTVQFTYLSQRYQAPDTLIRPALRKLAAAPAPPPASAPKPSATPPAAAAEAQEQTPPPAAHWERLNSGLGEMARCKVPGGWLVTLKDRAGVGLAFYPDAAHAWDGRSTD